MNFLTSHLLKNKIKKKKEEGIDITDIISRNWSLDRKNQNEKCVITADQISKGVIKICVPKVLFCVFDQLKKQNSKFYNP